MYNAPETKLLTTREAAEALGYTHDYISKMCRNGYLKAVRAESSWLITPEALEEFRKVHSSKLETYRALAARRAKSIKPKLHFLSASCSRTLAGALVAVILMGAGAAYGQAPAPVSLHTAHAAGAPQSASVYGAGQGALVAVHDFFADLLEGAGDALAFVFGGILGVNVAYAPELPSSHFVPAPAASVIQNHPVINNIANYFTTSPVTYVYSGSGASIEYVQAQIDNVVRHINRSSSNSSSSSGGSSDISSASLEDLGDVASMTKSFGDLLYWDGAEWSNIATSSLGIGAGSGSPGGSSGQVQFNNAGLFAGDAGFTYSAAASRITATYASTTGISSGYASTTNLGINSETFTDLTGAGLQNIGGALSINAAGDWTGTFDGQEGSYYLANSFSTSSARYFSSQYQGATTTLTAGTNVSFSGGTPVIFGSSPVTINATGGGLASYDAWTHPGAGQSATTSLMLLNGNASTTGISAAYASSTNAFFGTASVGGNLGVTGTANVGALSIGSLNGILKTISGAVVTATAGTDYENPLSFVYPLVRSVNSISMAFGTTTQNFWSAYNNFGSLFATNASSTNATTTNLHITSATNGGLAVDSNGRAYSAATTTAGTGLTYSGNAFNVNTSQNIATLSNLTSNGLVKTSGGTGALSIATPGTDYIAGGAGAATTTLTISGPFTTSATPVVFGSSPITSTYYGLATTSTLTSSQLLVSNGGAGVYGVSTTTASCAGTASCSSFTVLGSSPVTITGAGGGLSSYDAWTHPLTGWSATTSIMRMAGLYSTASSTIGDGTQAGGLTNLGGATTTANAYFGGKLGIGVQAPSSLLSVNYGFGGTQPIDITQSGTSIFTIDNAGRPTFSPTSATAGGSLYTFGNATGQVFSGGIAMMLNPQTVDSTSFLFGALVNNSIKFLISGTGATAIGTSSPWGYLAVNPTALGSGVPEFVVGSSSATHLIVDGAGNVGIGTTSPVSQLAVQGSGTFSGSLVAQNLTLSNALFLSGYGDGLLKNTGGTVGIATAGTDYLASYDAWTHPIAGQSATTSLMLFNGAASSTQLSATQAYFGGTATSTFTAAGFLGVGSSSPWAQLSINPTSANGTAPAFSVGSSTATNLIVTNAGNVGIGTSSPYKLLSIYGPGAGTQQVVVSASDDADASIRFENGGQRWNIGRANTAGSVPGDFFIFDSEGTAGTRLLIQSSTGNVGIGTTSPQWKLNVASASAPQLTLSDASATSAPFNFRAINSSLYISTSSPTTFATTTSSLFSLDSATGSTTLQKLTVTTIGTSSFAGGVQIQSGGLSLGTTLSGLLKSTSGAITGSVSGTDYVAGGTGSANQVTYFTGTGAIAGDAGMTYNATADRLTTTYASTTALSTSGSAIFATGGGNVGIGTTSPFYKLSVAATDSTDANSVSTGSQFAVTEASGSHGIYMRTKSNAGISGSTFANQLFSIGGNFGLEIYSDGGLAFGSANIERARISSTGNFGIGTTSPGIGLDVYKDNGSGYSARFVNTLGNSSLGILTSGGITGLQGLNSTGSGSANIFLNAAGGNVGIATTSPLDLLSIYGGASAGAINIGVWDSLRNGITLNGQRASSATSYNLLSGAGDPNLYLNRPSGSSIKFREANSSTDQFTLLTGGSATLPDGNLTVCTGGACPTGAQVGNGNIIAETAIGVGTSTPWAGLSVVSGKAIVAAENTLATTTSMTVDWRNGNQQLVRLGTSGTTISFSGFIEGQKLVLTVCNPNATAGAISWGTQVLWSSGTAPTQTTTANKCDVWSFLATNATSTLKIFGAQSANF